MSNAQLNTKLEALLGKLPRPPDGVARNAWIGYDSRAYVMYYWPSGPHSPDYEARVYVTAPEEFVVCGPGQDHEVYAGPFQTLDAALAAMRLLD